MENPCKDLEAYHDGELPPRERALAEEHLRGCPACAGRLAELRALDRLLAPPPALTGADISAAVLARLPAAAGPVLLKRSLRGWWKVPALALASGAAYALCVETGLLPSGAASLASALAAQNEASKISSLLFGRTPAGSEQLLAMVLEGDRK